MYKIYSFNSDDEQGIFINLRNLEVNNYGELLCLDKYLDKYSNYNKLILINVIPIDNTSSDIVNINKENMEYIEKIYNIISNHKNINIKFCSTSIRILNALNNYFIHNNCGYYVSDDLNYPDSKFYIFPEKKYNIEKIINEIKNNNLVYIFVKDDCFYQIKQEIINEINDKSSIYLIKKTL